MERRNTIQRKLILNVVRSLCGHVSAEEVYDCIRREYPSVGKGTVYRNLNILAEEGEIRRVEIPDGPDRFDFTLKDHYHIRCVRCGQVSDVDMDIITDMDVRIKDKHGFKFLDYDILFKGICPECQRSDAMKNRKM